MKKPGAFDPGAPTGAAGILPAELPETMSLVGTETAMWAVIFAGGIGSRFWPLSTPARPKPLLKLVSDHTLIEDSIGRLQPLIPPERVLICTSADIAPAIRSVTREVPEKNVLVEPSRLGTAGALAWAVQEVARRAGPTAMVVAMHADLAVDFAETFRMTLGAAAAAAFAERSLVAIGIKPTRPEVAFGYIQPGAPVDVNHPLKRGGATRTLAYVEKPSEHEAMSRIANGALWHGGIVVGSAGIFLQEIADHVEEVRDAMIVLAAGDVPGFVAMTKSISLERGLLERTHRLLVILGEFGWDDVGTWASLRRARELDDDGNGAIGRAHFVDAECNVVHCESGTVVVYGLSHVVVVTVDGLTFVTSLERSGDLRPLLDGLPDTLRDQPQGPGPS